MNSKKIQKKLDHDEVICTICGFIYIQPVTMPCGHTLCLSCFKKLIDLTSYQCHLCRRRLSNWLRKFKNDWNAMVNVNLWEAIQQQYPVEVQKQLNGEDHGLAQCIIKPPNRFEIKKGEIKKEFDEMRMKINEEEKQRELRSLELAKKLQEEEVAKIQTQTALIEEITREDSIIATSIQENMRKELHQEEIILIQSDLDLATKLQNQMSTETTFCTRKSVSEKKQITKGPLDKMFSKSTENNSEVQLNNTQNCSLSSTISSSSTQCEIQSPNKSLLSFPSDPCTSSSTIDSSEIFEDEDENVDTCTCGRLQDNLTTNSPCTFCIAQIAALNDLWTQQQNDFLVAKDLEKKLRLNNFEDYNLRKRPSSTINLAHKKKKKLSKGQLTLKQVLKDNGNITSWRQ